MFFILFYFIFSQERHQGCVYIYRLVAVGRTIDQRESEKKRSISYERGTTTKNSCFLVEPRAIVYVHTSYFVAVSDQKPR